jgi:hypothetical protein
MAWYIPPFKGVLQFLRLSSFFLFVSAFFSFPPLFLFLSRSFPFGDPASVFLNGCEGQLTHQLRTSKSNTSFKMGGLVDDIIDHTKGLKTPGSGMIGLVCGIVNLFFFGVGTIIAGTATFVPSPPFLPSDILNAPSSFGGF